MFKLKEKILYLFLTLILGCCLTTKVKAATIEDRLVTFNNELIPFKELKKSLCNKTDVGEIKFSSPITIDGVNVELYCTFENEEEAIDEVTKKYPTGFKYLKENFDLSGEVNRSNWQEYENAIYNAIYNNNVEDKDL